MKTAETIRPPLSHPPANPTTFLAHHRRIGRELFEREIRELARNYDFADETVEVIGCVAGMMYYNEHAQSRDDGSFPLANQAGAVFESAPDLLSALQALLVRSAQLDQSCTADGLNNCEAIAKARAAIARATGGEK